MVTQSGVLLGRGVVAGLCVVRFCMVVFFIVSHTTICNGYNIFID